MGAFVFYMMDAPITKNLFNFNEMTKIWLDPVVLSPKSVRVDVKIADAPANLFGVSFHLGINGLGWKMESYSYGSVFNGNSPIVLASAKENEIVAGMALKRGDMAEIKDGILMSFTIIPRESGRMEFSFSNNVLSVFAGGRRDLDGVEWVGGGIDVAVASQVKAGTRGDVNGYVTAVSGKTEEVTGLLGKDSKVSTFSEYGRIGDVYGVIGLFMLIFVVCSGIYLLYICRKRG